MSSAMPFVSSLSATELSSHLAKAGLYLQTGRFITRIQTTIDSVAEGIALLYADYPLASQTDFADFHVSLEQPYGLRRWYKRQVLFLFNGKSPFKPLPLNQAFPMLEWGMNWCVSSHAHRYLIIHAAVVEKDGKAAILPAPPGSGKSTLCAALVCRGWRLLSDELALVSVDDGHIIPLPRPVSLKNASIEIIQRYEPDATLSRPVTDTMKGTVAHMKVPTDSIARALQPANAAWVMFPRYQPGANAQLAPVSQSRAFLKIADNAFNYSTLGVKGFETLAKVVDASQCYEFTYSCLDDAIETFNNLPPRVTSP
jgi:HprK-related kinase A